MTSEIYLDAMDRLVEVTWSAPGEVSGFSTVDHHLGSGFSDSPFACSPIERPRDLDPELPCTRWTADGWILADRPDGGTFFWRYIEELGVVIGYSGTGLGGDFVVDTRLAELSNSLRLMSVEL